jgi:hypothetical protein
MGKTDSHPLYIKNENHIMDKKIFPDKPEEVPTPPKPEVVPEKVPEKMPDIPEEDPDIIPEEDPYEQPPVEIPPPGEGP